MTIQTATAAAEISDFITAEIMINGVSPVFTTIENGILTTRTATQVMAAALNAEETGCEISETVATNGKAQFLIHKGASVYARYTVR